MRVAVFLTEYLRERSLNLRLQAVQEKRAHSLVGVAIALQLKADRPRPNGPHQSSG